VHRSRHDTDVRLQQVEAGVPVFGGQYVVHLRRTGSGDVVTGVNGHYFTKVTAPPPPRISEGDALRLAEVAMSPLRTARAARHGLVILPKGDGVLAYHFTLRGRMIRRAAAKEVFVDAATGRTLLAYDAWMSDRPVTVPATTSHGDAVELEAYQRTCGPDCVRYEMRDRSEPMWGTDGGEITTHDVGGAFDYTARPYNIVTGNKPSFEAPGYAASGAVDAHVNARIVYRYYLEHFGRNSIDGRGMSIRSSVEAADPVTGGELFNAFWDGKQMVYGNPDPAHLHPLSAAIDIVGHELTHGVTQYTANLVYLDQPGAMNEAYSDYFGNAIQVDHDGTMGTAHDGYIGEGVCPEDPSRWPDPQEWPCPALRDLGDPQSLGYAGDTSGYRFYLADFDNGGVHENSSIYAAALWGLRERLFAQRGRDGADAADRYVYEALTGCETPLDDFVDGRNCVVTAAQEAAAAGAAPASDVDAVRAALRARHHGRLEVVERPRRLRTRPEHRSARLAVDDVRASGLRTPLRGLRSPRSQPAGRRLLQQPPAGGGRPHGSPGGAPQRRREETVDRRRRAARYLRTQGRVDAHLPAARRCRHEGRLPGAGRQGQDDRLGARPPGQPGRRRKGRRLGAIRPGRRRDPGAGSRSQGQDPGSGERGEGDARGGR
jgi:bacillolysin